MVVQSNGGEVVRPGISNELLERAGVRRVCAAEAQALCGLDKPGLYLPYWTLAGEAVLDGQKTYGRLRLKEPSDSKKYHQGAGTIVHAYLPPGLKELPPGGDLTVIEGEFKALSLVEAGIPAVGISGFFGSSLKGGEPMTPELKELIEYFRPKRILFCGDSDTALNHQFSIAAVRLVNMVDPIPVVLPRIPINGPGKGADDCRQALNGNFDAWWRERVNEAVPVKADSNPGLLAVDLFEREQGVLASLEGQARYEAEQKVIKLAAALNGQPMLKERILNFAEKKLGIGRRGLTQAVKNACKREKLNSGPESVKAYYYPGRPCYYIENNRAEMIEVNESSMKRHLLQAGISGGAEEGEMSPADLWLGKIQTEQDVVYAGPLAGYPVGVREMCGQRILVTRPPHVLKPVAGPCPTIEKLITGLLSDPNHDQISYFMGWLKVAYEAVAEGKPRHGQALAIAGPRDCGKSLLQSVITEVLGGRAAKPYRYMCGGTDFNADLFGAEHLMIEDEVAFTVIGARRHFGARIKDFTVNSTQSCHGKNRQALSLQPFWRVSITLNDEPENLLILPPIDESLEDKIILFRAYKNPMPMETRTLAGRQKFMATLIKEVPMFIYHLQRFQIPEQMRSERFGVTHFQHPDLMASLSEMSPEMKLLGLVDGLMADSETPGQWSGTAAELERLLSDSKFSHEAHRLLDWTNATGTYLGRLAKQVPQRVRPHRSNNKRLWIINPEAWADMDSEASDTLQ